MKIVDIDNNKLSEGLGRCPKYPQGTRPLTQIRALPEPILDGCQETFAAYPRTTGAAVFHGSPDNGSAPVMQMPDFVDLR